MKKIFWLIALAICVQCGRAQTPTITSWVLNLTGATGYNNIPSNVQSVSYTATDVYVSASCIPGYSIGPWNGNPNTPVNKNFVFKITRNPQQNTGAEVATPLGHTGVWTNGVSIFNAEDAMSYNNQGIWKRNAYYWEGNGFDDCLGHPAPGGEYHHHVNPRCLYDPTDSTHHSPIIGYAFDGFPIYGAYGFANTDGSGGIKRIKSSYLMNTYTTRINGPAVNTQYPMGCFVEDFTFSNGAGDLDEHNGRFCKTPEYPDGIYAYFVTIDAALKPVYPYTMGPTYYGVVPGGNTGPMGGHNNIPGNATKYTPTSNTPTVGITSAQGNSICEGTAVTFSASISNGGTAPTYQWRKNSQPVGSNTATYTDSELKDNDTIRCTLTSNLAGANPPSVTSSAVIIRVQQKVTPEVLISTPTNTITSGTSVTFTAVPNNGGSTPVYQWKKNNLAVGTNAPTYTDNALVNGDVIRCSLTSNANCISLSNVLSNSITMVVNGTSFVEGDAENGVRVQLSPNPAGDVVKLRVEAISTQEINVEMFSALGEALHRFEGVSVGSDYAIDLSGIAPGTYFLRVSVAGKSVLCKIAKVY